MTKRKVGEEDVAVCATPVKITKKQKITFGESTIIRPLKNVVVVKKVKTKQGEK